MIKVLKKTVKVIINNGPKLVSKLISNETILVLGDSHAKVFNHTLFKLKYPFKFFDVNDVPGATISGIDNPNSKTNAIRIFKKVLSKPNRVRRIILLLGEVDTGFVIWHKAERDNLNVMKILDNTLTKYQNFIQSCIKIAPVIVISAPLPTITDDNDWGEIANLRKEVKATQVERTNLTLKLNNETRHYCKANGIDYLDLDKLSIGSNGIVSEHLLNKNNTDHHYDKKKYAKLIIKNIKPLL